MTRARNRIAEQDARPAPRVRRAYYDCRYGQLHVHQAMPAGGGFDEATTLLCLPGQPGSGRFFVELLAPLGRDRSIYALDLPGCGESDGGADLAVDSAATAVGDLLDTLRLRRVDLLAHGSGMMVALALIAQRSGTIHRLAYSAADAAAQPRLRGLPCPVAEIALAAAEAPAMSAADAERVEPQLRAFLGSAAPG
jgi:pimeloyl-ACP methyl ester carboxylesterase